MAKLGDAREEVDGKLGRWQRRVWARGVEIPDARAPRCPFPRYTKFLQEAKSIGRLLTIGKGIVYLPKGQGRIHRSFDPGRKPFVTPTRVFDRSTRYTVDDGRWQSIDVFPRNRNVPIRVTAT